METQSRSAWTVLILPASVWLFVVFFLPVVQLLITSFYRPSGQAQWVRTFTLSNYAKFLADPFFLRVLRQTFALALITTVICAILGYPVAYFLARTRSRFRPALILLIMAPLLISIVVRGLGWLIMLSDQGVINWFLLKVGLLSTPLPLLGNFTGIVIGLVHALLPFMIITLLNSIQKVETSLEEASLNLGAGTLLTFFRVIIPLTKEGLLSGSLLVFAIAISAFTTPTMLGGRKVLTMPILIEQQVRFVLNYPFGAAASVILILLTMAFTYVITFLIRPRSNMRAG